jgi:Flp pilus assembly protein TadG
MPLTKSPRGSFWRNTAGGISVMYALTLPALMGFTGLGVEVAYWYVSKRNSQSAADAGAVAGALELTYGGDKSDIHDQAVAEAVRNGFSNGAGTAIAVNNPPLAGAYKGDKTAVEVVLDTQHDTMFAAVVYAGDVTVEARAVARQAPGTDVCVLALNKTAHDAVTNQGNVALNLEDCTIASNSTQNDSISLSGDSTLNAESLWTSGKVDAGNNATVNIENTPVEQGFPIDDPYKNTPIPSTTSPCIKAKTITGTTTLTTSGFESNPTTICTPNQDVHLVGGDVINVEPGVYVFDNVGLKVDAGATLTCNACSPGGKGVTFVFTGDTANQVGAVDINGSATVKLNAPSSGTYSGLLFYQDPKAANNSNHNSTINGGANIELTGALYFPSTHLNMNGDLGGNSECTWWWRTRLRLVAAASSIRRNARITASRS